MTEIARRTESTEVALTQPVPSRMSMPAKLEYVRTLAHSGMLPKQYQGNPANLLWAVEYAEMLGVHPLQAITGIHVIEGKPSASSALISAMVRRAGHRLRVRFDEKTMTATAQIIRSDDPDYTFEASWNLDRAKAANLTGKSVWKSYPAAMLKARAITEVAREACEEALSGVRYTPEELNAEVDEDENVIDGSIVTTVAPEPFSAPAKPKPDVPQAKYTAAFVKAFSDEGLSADDAQRWFTATQFPEGDEPASLPYAQAMDLLEEAKTAAVAEAARQSAAEKTKAALEGDVEDAEVVGDSEDLGEWDMVSKDGEL